MKIKRTLSLLLSLVLLVGILCGCGGNPTSYDDDDDDDRPSSSRPKEDPTEPTDDSSTPTEPEKPTNKIDMSQIDYSTDFSEGLAFIELSSDDGNTHCINKKGEIVFSLDDDYTCGTFRNGIAFIYREEVNEYGNYDVYICDTLGNLTSAADLNASSFVTVPSVSDAEPYDCLFGDYILVIKSTNTYAGSTNELGVLTCDLEYIVEPSAELYSKYLYYKVYKASYYGGYLYTDNRYLNLLTGDEGSDLNDMSQNLQYKFPSDIWKCNIHWNGGYYYFDVTNNETKIDLSQYSDTLTQAGNFENGTTHLMFYSKGASTSEYYFTILGEDGQFKFEPFLLSNYSQYRQYFVTRDNHKYMVHGKTQRENDTLFYAYIFDESGLLFQAEQTIPGEYSFATISDDVIRIIDPFNHVVNFYDLNLNPLF